MFIAVLGLRGTQLQCYRFDVVNFSSLQPNTYNPNLRDGEDDDGDDDGRELEKSSSPQDKQKEERG